MMQSVKKVYKSILVNMFNSKKKQEDTVIKHVMPIDVEFDMKTILNDYWPLCTIEGKSKITEIITEYAQINYGFIKPKGCTDIDVICYAFRQFNPIDSANVRHRVHELTYLPQYFTIDYTKDRKEAANIIRGMFHEYNMESMIESTLPGFGNMDKHMDKQPTT